MADFFKGLAGGFQTGLQMGQQIRNRRMEDELGQAYAKPETFTDYTPEQAAQIRGLQATGAYDVEAVPGAAGAAPTLRYTPRQGLDLQGDMPAAPVEIAPQQVQRYRDQTTAGQFDPTALRGLQMQESANVLGRYGKVQQAEDLRARAEEQAYQAKVRPLQLQGLEQQTKLGGTQLAKAQREAAEQQKYDQFTQAYADAKKANPNLTNGDVSAMPEWNALNVDQKYNFASRVTGIAESEFKSSELAIKNLIRGKNLDEQLELHKKSDLLDKGSHYEKVRGPNDTLGIQRVDSNTNQLLGDPKYFRNEEEATGYLYTMATRPEAAVEYAAALEKQAQDRRKLDLEEQKTRAQIGLYGAQSAALGARAQMGEKPLKDEKVPDAGTRLRRPNGSVVQADGRGGYIALEGVLPDARPDKLAELKVPPHVADVAKWSIDGTALGFNNAAYPLTEAGVKALTKAVNAAGANAIKAREADVRQQTATAPLRALERGQVVPKAPPQVTPSWAGISQANEGQVLGLTRGQPYEGVLPDIQNMPLQYGPKITYGPDPDAPNLYAPQESWAAYRARLQNRYLEPR